MSGYYDRGGRLHHAATVATTSACTRTRTDRDTRDHRPDGGVRTGPAGAGGPSCAAARQPDRDQRRAALRRAPSAGTSRSWSPRRSAAPSRTTPAASRGAARRRLRRRPRGRRRPCWSTSSPWPPPGRCAATTPSLASPRRPATRRWAASTAGTAPSTTAATTTARGGQHDHHHAPTPRPTPVTRRRRASAGSRADRAPSPRARDVLRDTAVEFGVCVRPVPMRRVDLATGETEIKDIPCGVHPRRRLPLLRRPRSAAARPAVPRGLAPDRGPRPDPRPRHPRAAGPRQERAHITDAVQDADEPGTT